MATPQAELQGTCRKRPRSDGTVVANLEAVNTGNVGVVVRVSARWPQADGGGVSRWRRVRLEQGEPKPVKLELSLAGAEADKVRRAADGHRTCRFSHRIVGAFGVPGG